MFGRKKNKASAVKNCEASKEATSSKQSAKGQSAKGSCAKKASAKNCK